jgi:hypothetical protein
MHSVAALLQLLSKGILLQLCCGNRAITHGRCMYVYSATSSSLPSRFECLQTATSSRALKPRSKAFCCSSVAASLKRAFCCSSDSVAALLQLQSTQTELSRGQLCCSSVAALLQLCCSFSALKPSWAEGSSVAALLQLCCSSVAASAHSNRAEPRAALLQLCCSSVAALLQLQRTQTALSRGQQSFTSRFRSKEACKGAVY